MPELALASDMLPMHLHTGPAGEPEVNGSLDAEDAEGEEPQLQRKQPKKKKQSKRSVSFDMDDEDGVRNCLLASFREQCQRTLLALRRKLCACIRPPVVQSHGAQLLLAFSARLQQLPRVQMEPQRA